MAHVYRRAFSEGVTEHYRSFTHRAALPAAHFHSFAICRDGGSFAIHGWPSNWLVREHTTHWSAIVGRDYRQYFHAAGPVGRSTELELSNLVDQRGVHGVFGLPFCVASDCAGTKVNQGRNGRASFCPARMACGPYQRRP